MQLKRLHTLLTKFALASAVLALFAGGLTANFGGNVLAQLFTPTAKQTVVLLVNEALYQETQQFEGLASQYSDLSNTTIKARVDKYANAIQQDLPLTKTVILPVPATVTTKQVHDQLANLALFESEEIEGKLAGVVLVGEIPLPTVNGKVSMYPYTDFVAPRFSWSEGRGEFVSSQNTNQPELWHGVIKFENAADYAQYFDKNFLARTGHPNFKADGQNLFVADLAEEEVSLNEDLAQTYANHLAISKDRVYNRYTKELLQALQTSFANTLEARSSDPKAIEAFNKLRNNLGGNTELAGQLPDVLVKSQIEKVAQPVSALFQSYFNRIITALEQTGRYYFDLGEITNPIRQIALVDAYQEQYFKAVNDLLEQKVEALAEEAAEPVRLFKGLEIDGEIVVNGQRRPINEQVFVNHRVKAGASSFLNLIVAATEGVADTGNVSRYFSLGDLYVNSTNTDQIEGAYQCRLYRGSEDGKIVETIRNYTFDGQTKCYRPWGAGEAGRWQEDPAGCEPFYGTNLQDLHRTSVATGVFDSATTHEACYELRTAPNYFAAEQKQVDPADVENPRNIVLATAGGQRVTLADVILAIDPEANLADRHKWSAMFANVPNGRLTVELPNGEARLQIKTYGNEKAVNSVIYHKDPTNDLLNQQLQENLTKDLPVDNTRYVSFLNSAGQTEKIDYPDVFSAGSYQQLIRDLRRLETQFSELTGESKRGELTSILTETADNWNDEYTELMAANELVLENLINWSNSDLNRKYQQVLQLELNGQAAWGELLPTKRYEAAVLNLKFDEDLLATEFPAVGKTDIGGFEVTKPQEQEVPEPERIEVDVAALEASPTCAQYYNARQTAAKVLDYLDYLDCWLEHEVIGTADELVRYPAQFLPLENTALPTRNQILEAIDLIPERQVIAVSSEQADKPFRVQVGLVNERDEQLVGQAVTVNVAISGPAQFANGSTEQEVYLVTGKELVELELTGEAGEVRLVAKAGGVEATTQFMVEPAYELRLSPETVAAGSNATVRLQLTKAHSSQQWPRSLKINDLGQLGLGEEFVVTNGSVNLPVVVPKKAGSYPLFVALPNGQTTELSLEVKAEAAAKLLLHDRKSKSVSRFEEGIAMIAVDQYGNQLTGEFEGTVSLTEGAEVIELGATEFTAEAGLIRIPFTFKAIGNVGLNVTIADQTLPINFLLTENLTKEQLAKWQINSLYLNLRHNEVAVDESLVGNWLKGGVVQTIAVQPATTVGDNLDPLLKISGSNLIGVAHQAEMGETDIVFGDPTFSLKPNRKENVFDFSADIGELVATTENTITQLAAVDNKVAIGTQTGEIIELTRNNQKVISKMPLGVKALTWWKPEPEATPVLLAVTKESCSKLKGCLFAFEFNEDGKLERKPLPLGYQGKINKLFVVDLTQDGRDDLLVLDGVDDLLLFPNVEVDGERTLKKEPVRIANTGLIVDSNFNLNEYFLVSGAGLEMEAVANVDNLRGSRMTVRDENGGNLRSGDRVTYNVRLRTGDAALNGLRLLLPLGDQYELIPGSLNCAGCSLETLSIPHYSHAITGINIAANSEVNLSFAARVAKIESSNAQVQIVMDAANYPADGEPDILIVVPGTNLQTYYYSSRNNDGNIVYLRYQQPVGVPTLDESDQSTYEQGLEELISGERSRADILADKANRDYENYISGDRDEDGLLDTLQNGSRDVRDFVNEVGDEIESFFCSRGCLALPVNYAFLVDGILPTERFQAVPVFGLTPPPAPVTLYGPAALAPVTVYRFYISPTLTGETAMANCFGIYPAGLCSVTRLVGLQDIGDICEKINHGIVDLMNGAVDVAQSGLDEINEQTGRTGIKVSLKPSTDKAPPGVSVSTNVKVPGFPEVLTNWFSAQMQEVLNLLDLPDLKIIYPDLTTYFDADTEEATQEEEPESAPERPEPEFESDIPGLAATVNAVNDFQENLEQAEAELNSINDLFADIADNALVDVEEEIIDIQYPYLTPEEILEFQTRLLKWYDDLEQEVEVALASWGCYGTALGDLGDIDNLQTIANELIESGRYEQLLGGDTQESACASLVVAWAGMAGTINENIEILASYLELPYLIFEIENFEAKYAGAVVGYMDQVNEHIVQWLNENTERIKSWQNMLIDLQTLWEDVSFLVNISLEYFKQCDDCRSHRFSNLQLLLELFIQIPEPPVIELPKLPDITLDVSDVQAGVTLTIPNFDIQPVPVELPDLPRVTLPKAPPINFAARLPEFGIFAGITLPAPPDFGDIIAVLELPELPELVLPRLPLLPLPPDIGDYAASFTAEIKVYLDIVSEVLRIACIIEKGLLPTVPEFALKQQVEAITARPLTPILPIDVAAGIGFELPDLPTFNYLKEIRIIGHTYLNIDVSIFVDVIKELAAEINSFTTDFTEGWNEQIRELNQQGIDLLNLDIDFEGINVELEPREEAVKESFEKDLSDLGASDYRLLAQSVNDQARLTPAPTAEDPLKIGTEPGLYVSDPETGNVAKLIDYVPAEFADTVMTFVDFDNDGDEDILYSIANELYLKANRDETAETEHLNSRPEVRAWNEPMATKQVSFNKGSDFVRVNLPELAEDEVVVLELSPTGLTEQAIAATYVVTGAELAEALTDDFAAAERDWQQYTGNRRSLDFGEAEVAKGRASELYWQQAGPTVSLPLSVGEITLQWRLIKAGEIKSAKETFTFSNLQCGDETPPRVNLGNQAIEVIVYQPVEVDATNSTDSAGNVIGYFVDRNLQVDSDRDGNPRNDRNLTGDADPEVDTDFDGNPANDASVGTFRLQAYDKPGQHKIGVGVIDDSGNEHIEEVTINVSLPQITINQVTANSISGYITPAVPNIPLQLVREREGQIELIVNTEGASRVTTDRTGRFVLDNLEAKDVIVVRDVNGDVIAEIDTKTGNITTQGRATVKIETEADTNGTRLVILDAEGNYVTSVIKRSNGLNDVVEISDEDEIAELDGDLVAVQDLEQNDDYVWELLSGADAGFPGAAALVNNGRHAIVTPTGQIYLINKDLTLELTRVRDLKDSQWIVIKEGNKALARVLVRAGEKVEFKEVSTKTNQVRRPRVAPTFEPTSPFTDLSVDDPDFNILKYLYQTNVIEGRVQDGERRADLESRMTRAEFTKTILAMLCIEPSEEAKQLPAVFADITAQSNGQLPWFFSYTKEGFMRGFVTGYEGQVDPVTGLPLFLPQNNISRAEAAKVILEVLEAEGTVDLSDLPEAAVWYVPFMEAAQEYGIITAAEAQTPDRNLTRREFFQMVDRVLKLSNCLEQDEDRNGLPQHFEQEFDVTDPNDDPDADGLTNLEEFRRGTDPLDPDTDDGGVNDGTEVGRGTNPLDGNDDQAGPEIEPGVYVEEIPCLQCPCPYTVDYASTLVTNDRISAIIKGRDGKIVQESNSVIYTK